MHTSAQPVITRSLSQNRISVNKEVTVVSSHGDRSRQNSSPSTTSSGPSHLSGARSSPDMRCPGLNNSLSNYGLDPKVTDWSSSDSNIRRRRTLAGEERNRESVKELVEFFRTKDPPPHNWMSIPEPATHSERRLSLRIFQRKNVKRCSSTPRPFRLPDSAVAARTTSGRWYIAISIPKECDLAAEDPNTTSLARQEARHPTRVDDQDRPIRVLKPVLEEKSSPSSERTDAPVGESTSFFAQHDETALPKKETLHSGRAKARISGSRQDYVPVSSNGLSRRNSRRSNQRHSGEIVCSEKTIGLKDSCSRPNASRRVEPPKRSSSKPRSSVPLRDVPSNMDFSLVANGSGERHSEAPSRSASEGVTSRFINSELEPPNITKSCEPAVVANASMAPQTAGPAPDKKLPELPEGSREGRSLRRQSPTHTVFTAKEYASESTTHNTAVPISRGSSSLGENSQEATKTHVKRRQERVKALRARDMANLKTNVAKTKRVATCESAGTVKHHGPNSAAPSSEKQFTGRTLCSSPLKTEPLPQYYANSISRIMMVADLAPTVESSRSKCQEPNSGRRKAKRASSVNISPTPPYSPRLSLASSDGESLNSLRLLRRARSTGTRYHRRPSNSSPRTRRASHKMKPNTSIVASAMTSIEDHGARLSRLEKNGSAMLQALNAVVQTGASLKELDRLLPHGSETDLIEAAGSNDDAVVGAAG